MVVCDVKKKKKNNSILSPSGFRTNVTFSLEPVLTPQIHQKRENLSTWDNFYKTDVLSSGCVQNISRRHRGPRSYWSDLVAFLELNVKLKLIYEALGDVRL